MRAFEEKDYVKFDMEMIIDKNKCWVGKLLQYSPYTNDARIQAIDDEFNTFSIGGGQGYHRIFKKNDMLIL